MKALRARAAFLAIGGTLASLVVAAPARAADPIACAASAERAQSLRQENKLIDARKELVACTSADCPKFVRADCARWLEEVVATLPSIVVRAVDANGKDVVDAAVDVDGKSAALGVAVPLDPGPHAVAAHRGSDKGAARILVAAGEKNRVIVVPFERGAAPAEPEHVAPGEAPRARVGHGPWPFVAGGVGVAGLVAFGVLQVAAQDQYDKLKDRCAPGCDASEVDSVRTKVTLSAVALGVGAVGVGAALVLWFATTPNDASVSVGAAPTVGGAAGSVRVRF